MLANFTENWTGHVGYRFACDARLRILRRALMSKLRVRSTTLNNLGASRQRRPFMFQLLDRQAHLRRPAAFSNVGPHLPERAFMLEQAAMHARHLVERVDALLAYHEQRARHGTDDHDDVTDRGTR